MNPAVIAAIIVGTLLIAFFFINNLVLSWY